MGDRWRTPSVSASLLGPASMPALTSADLSVSASGFATPVVAAPSRMSSQLSSALPDMNNWQYQDLWLGSGAQAMSVPRPEDLSARLNALALGPGGSLAPLGPVITGFGSAVGPARSPYGPPAARRAPLEVNHNKAITKKLASAVHYQQVQSLVSTPSLSVLDARWSLCFTCSWHKLLLI